MTLKNWNPDCSFKVTILESSHMDQRQQEVRRTAAKDFFQSLDDLQDMFQKEHRPPARSAPPSDSGGNEPKARDLTPTEPTALERVVADIEEFFHQHPE